MSGKKITYESLERLKERYLARCKGWQGRSHIEDVSFASAYAEPGYSDPESGWIAFGNWNTITEYDPVTRKSTTVDTAPAEFGEILEKIGVAIEWSDEWSTCGDCGKAVREKADSYGWTPSFAILNECELVCIECIQKDPEEYIENMIGKESNAMTIDVDLEEHGFVLLESDFENGFHPGQDADPHTIAESLRELGVDRFIFVIDDVGQFDLSFSVWVDKEQLKTLDLAKWESAEKDGPSVSQGLERALQAASQLMSENKGEGIAMVKCDVSTGTAELRTITPQEFIDGIKD